MTQQIDSGGFRERTLPVVEIFESIEGEGIRAGAPCTFIRLFGCNLNCSYCDSRYAWEPGYKSEAVYMSLYDIIGKCRDLGQHYITVTGGEPLIHPNTQHLVYKLASLGFEVNIETNGTFPPPVRHANIFYTVDYKTKGSGVNDKMDLKVFDEFRTKDVFKFVVGSLEDCYQAETIIKQYPEWKNIYLSPVFGEIEAKDIVEFLRKSEVRNRCRVQLQMHKYIWDKDMRGV